MNLYRKLLLCVSLAVILIPPPAMAADYVPGDVLVVLKPSNPEIIVTASDLDDFGTESFRVASFAAESGAWVKNTYASISEAGNEIFALIHSDQKSTEELVKELQNNSEVLAVSPNYMVHAAVIPDDTDIGECWGLRAIGAYEAWETTKGSDEVYVAVIDSGIDETNPDLAPNVAVDLGYNALNPQRTATDDFGHGTHVAGTIGAAGNNSMGIAGVNWNVKIIPVKALDSGGSGTIDNVIDAINYVTGLIQRGINIKAVNLSLETYLPYQPIYDTLVRLPLWRAFKDLDKQNKAVIVVAAGNQSETIGQPSTYAHGSMVRSAGLYVYPPSFQGLYGMISVSAVDQSGTIADFSNKGADISAPGVDILSTWLQSSVASHNSDGISLRVSKGTSMAAPHVAGAAALLASIVPEATAYQIKQILINNSAESSFSASEAKGLNIKAVIDYGKNPDAVASILAQGSDWEQYDNYDQVDLNDNENLYQYEDDINENGDSGGGAGACGSGELNVFALVLVFPLVKRYVS